MPTYKITDPETGKTVKLTGDSPPTENELKMVFSRLNGKPVDAKPSASEGMGTTRKFLTGVGAGMYDVGKGTQETISRLASKLPIPGAEEAGQRAEQRAAERAGAKDVMAPLKEESTAAKAGEFVGQTVPFMAMPGGAAGGLARRAAASAAGGAVQGQILEGDPLTGAVTGGATSVGLSLGSKAINALRGVVPPNAIADLAKKFGIPLTLGEQTGKAGVLRTETLLERAPSFLGLGNFRVKQNEAAHQAAKDFLGKYIADPLSADVSASNRKYASDLFDIVRGKVAGIPVQDIAPTETKRSASVLLARYPDIFKKLQDAKTEGLISDIVHGVKDVPTPASRVLGPSGQPAIPASVKAKNLTFEEAWTLRQGLGEKIGQARKMFARGELDQTAYSQIKELFGAVSRDMDNWTAQIKRPDIAESFKQANEAYRTFVVKHDIVQRAYDKALGTVGAGEFFSPKKFSTALKSIAYKDQSLKTFSPAEIKEMTGLANILQVVKRSGQFMENPPTGNRWGGLGLGALIEGAAYKAGGMTGMLQATGGAAAASGIATFLTSTKVGKNLALAASTLEPKSKAMQKIVEQVYKQAPRFATGATMGMSPLESATMTEGE